MANAADTGRRGRHAPLQQRNSHALGDPWSGSFRFGHPDCPFMLRDFSNPEHDPETRIPVSEKIMLK
jgi:hypothetical protein